MNNTILFSPIGGHDPIANFHDGAMLHISRKYRPTKIYMYLSKEMIERKDLDDRYKYSVNRLREVAGFETQIIEIERKDLKDVHLFDIFYHDFEQIISEIVTENPDCKLILNVSSGTPAMKSALEIIAALSGGKVTAVQVATPEGKENTDIKAPKEYDNEIYWDMNIDNDHNYNDRCTKINSVNLLARVKLESVKKLISSYDYPAALVLAKEIENDISEKAMNMIEVADCRYNLDIDGCFQLSTKQGFDFIPLKKNFAEHKIFEYLLNLDVKLKKKNYADFIRAITPIVFEVFDFYLKQKHKIDFRKQYCDKNGKIKDNISIDDKVIAAVAKSWNNDIDRIKNNFCGSSHLVPIILEFSDDEVVKEKCNKLRTKVESGIRNFVAHEIMAVTEKVIEQKTGGVKPDQVVADLKFIFTRSTKNIKPEYWNSYEDMNTAIINELNSIRF